MTDLSLIGVAICVPLVVIFGIIALLNTTNIYQDDSVVFYLTARNTFGARKITLSFFGVAVGAWLFLIPSKIIADPTSGTGLLGMISFSCSFFGAIWMFGLLGAVVKERYPSIISIGDYAKTRFDYSTQLFITAVVFGNIVLGMSNAPFLAMAQDYIAIGKIFSQTLGIAPIFPIMTVGIVTAIYTSIGGLYASIMAHQYQLMLSILLLLTISIYIGVTFDWEELGPLPPHLGITEKGGKSFITNTISVFSTCFFSDALWQRVWAAKDTDSLRKGSFYGGILSCIFVLIFCFFSFLYSWAGYTSSSANDVVNILQVGNGAPSWILLLVSMLAIIINETTIDAVQNALANSLISLAMSFGVRLSLNWTRIVVFVINILSMLIAIQELDVVSLGLFSDMMTGFAMGPIVLSMFEWFDEYINQVSILFSYVLTIIALLLYGYIYTGTFFYGVYTFVYLNYDAAAFALVFFGPMVGLVICNLIENFIMSTKFGRHKFGKIKSKNQQTSDLFSDMQYIT